MMLDSTVRKRVFHQSDHFFLSSSLGFFFRSERPGLGHVLLQHGPFLRMYADYVRNFDQAVELVRVWNERSAAFRNITQDIQVQVCSASGLIPTCTSQRQGPSRPWYSPGFHSFRARKCAAA